MAEGKHVSHIPSYGAEMRGGTANCSVVVSDEEIASPLVPHPAVLHRAEHPVPRQVPGRSCGRAGSSSGTARSCEPPAERADIEYLAVPANELAEAAGSYKAANMVVRRGAC